MFTPCWLSIAVPARAADVLVVYSDYGGYYVGDLLDKLDGTARFPVLDTFDARFAPPPLSLLTTYDAVFVFSNGDFGPTNEIGDRLADYVDQGGAVVQAMFANTGTLAPVQGRFHQYGYDPLYGDDMAYGGARETLVPLDASHPIFAGVSALDNGSWSYHNVGAVLSSTAVALAEWSDGELAVAVDQTHVGTTVGLNLFPASDDAFAGLWDADTDGATLMANALEWASGVDTDGDLVKDPYDDCPYVADPEQLDSDGDGIGDACDLCPPTDTDTDEDGLCDAVDACPGFNDWQDTDGDAVSDGCDVCPLDAPDDIDGDGVCGADDLCVGDPNVDEDHDGVCDAQDACPGHDDAADADGDSHADGCDCAPTNPHARPGADEVCDGIDNDCDGETDPPGSVGSQTFYADVDGDGYGVDGAATLTCLPPLNHAATAGDCDDSDGAVHPGADEVCDRLDNDCDGAVDSAECWVAEPRNIECGCASGPPSPGLLAALGVLALLRRRR